MDTETEKPKYQVLGLAGKKSIMFVVPKNLAEGMGFEKGDFVRVSREKNRLIVEKAEQ